MKIKRLRIIPILFLFIICLCTVSIQAATLGKVTGVKIKQLSDEKVKLTWSTKTWAKGYEVYQKTGSGKYKKIKTTAAQSLTIKGLNAGKTNYFRVRAYKKSAEKKVYGKYKILEHKKLIYFLRQYQKYLVLSFFILQKNRRNDRWKHLKFLMNCYLKE